MTGSCGWRSATTGSGGPTLPAARGWSASRIGWRPPAAPCGSRAVAGRAPASWSSCRPTPASRRASPRQARPRSASGGPACLDRGDELAAEIRDVGYHPAPHQVAVAEGGLVHPDRARVYQVVLDAQAAGGALAVHDPGRDPVQAGVADQADDLALMVGLGDQL